MKDCFGNPLKAGARVIATGRSADTPPGLVLGVITGCTPGGGLAEYRVEQVGQGAQAEIGELRKAQTRRLALLPFGDTTEEDKEELVAYIAEGGHCPPEVLARAITHRWRLVEREHDDADLADALAPHRGHHGDADRSETVDHLADELDKLRRRVAEGEKTTEHALGELLSTVRRLFDRVVDNDQALTRVIGSVHALEQHACPPRPEEAPHG